MKIQPSVIVSTYNQPHELELVLCGLNMQVHSPLEILIADDGSTQETKNLIKQWTSKSKIPIKHIWHEDIGHRKSKINNKAVNESTGNYLVFLDGDSIPHRYWIEDHVNAARSDTVVCGRRVRLGPKISKQIDLEFLQSRKLESLTGPVLSSALEKDTKRYLLGIRLPKNVARCLHPKERRLMGVNFSLHKILFKRVGGYIEYDNKNFETTENVREDAQLEIQLIKIGVLRYPLINQGIVYHLFHPERPPNKKIDAKIQSQYLSALEERKLSKINL